MKGDYKMGFIKGILESLTIFDYISPVVESGKDFSNFTTDIHGTLDISVNKGDLREAKKTIEGTGYKVISITTVAYDNEAHLSVESYGGPDGYESIRTSLSALHAKGIDAWVYLGWA